MIRVAVDTAELEKALGNLKSEIPFALARAINDTLLDIQKKQIENINDRFTIRRPNFVKKSVKITKFSKKQDLDGEIAIADVGGKSTKDILGKFEKGTTKKSRTGGKVAIPSEFIRPDRGRVVSKGKRPSQLKNTFRVDKGETSLLFQRKGKGKNRTINLAYILKGSVKIDRRLSFVDIAVRVFNKDFNDNVNKRLQEGIKKAGFKNQ